jgi:hypothetical protein
MTTLLAKKPTPIPSKYKDWIPWYGVVGEDVIKSNPDIFSLTKSDDVGVGATGDKRLAGTFLVQPNNPDRMVRLTTGAEDFVPEDGSLNPWQLNEEQKKTLNANEWAAAPVSVDPYVDRDTTGTLKQVKANADTYFSNVPMEETSTFSKIFKGATLATIAALATYGVGTAYGAALGAELGASTGATAEFGAGAAGFADAGAIAAEGSLIGGTAAGADAAGELAGGGAVAAGASQGGGTLLTAKNVQLGLSALSLANSITSGMKTNKATEEAMQQQQALYNAQVAATKKAQQEETATLLTATRKRAAGASNIKTSGQGVLGAAPVTKKTLLGA